MKTKPIQPTLRNMKVGDTEVFSLDVYGSVNSTRDRVSCEKRFKFEMKRDNKERTVSITRVM